MAGGTSRRLENRTERVDVYTAAGVVLILAANLLNLRKGAA